MDLTVRGPGWVEWQGRDGVSAEVKVLTHKEGSAFDAQIRALQEGTMKPEEFTASNFRAYVRAIKGVVVNGKALCRPEDFDDPSIGFSRALLMVQVEAVNRFLELNMATEEESKNSNAPPVDTGAAAGTEKK